MEILLQATSLCTDLRALQGLLVLAGGLFGLGVLGLIGGLMVKLLMKL